MIFIPVVAGLVVLAVVVFFMFIWRRVVPTNMVHIVQSSKKTVDYGRGRQSGNVYYEFPSFLPIVGVSVTQFPESVFGVNLKEYEAYDINRLPFSVDVAAFFRISDSQMAAQRVSSFNELQSQLTNVLQGAVRRILATNVLENIMQDRSSLGDQFTEEVDSQLEQWGVSTVKAIEFMDIHDSAGSNVIANIMAKDKSRIERESRVEVAENVKQAETKEIEAKREVQLRQVEAEQTVGMQVAEKDKAVGIAKEKSNQDVLEEAKTTAERNMEVTKVNQVRQAEIDRDVAVVDAERDKRVQVVAAEAAKESQVIAAQAERESKVQIADGDLQSTLKESEGVKALGEAKADAEQKMLMAPVNSQIELAREIGANEGYQTYLIEIRRVEATEVVGKEMAGALRDADLKVIANGGDVQSGIGNLADVLSPKGGTSIAGMLEALGQTEAGQKVIERVVGDTKTRRK